jgi:integrase
MYYRKPNIPDLNYRSGLRYAIGKAVNYLKQGIGMSKRETMKLHNGFTPYVHNYDTLKRYVGIMNNLSDKVLVPANVNTINKIATKHIKEHFENLLNDNDTENTIDLNATALNKFFHAFNRDDLITYINENRGLWLSSATPSGRTNPFVDPDKVIGFMIDPYKSAAIIQKVTGSRAGDIKKVVDSVLSYPSSNIIYIRKSKGGRSRMIDFSDRPNELKLVHQAVHTIDKHFTETKTNWTQFLKEYTKEVRRAARKAGEIYCGPHAFRANYAETRYETLSAKQAQIGTIDDEKQQEEAVFKTITEELGHSRTSMAKYYIPTFRKS